MKRIISKVWPIPLVTILLTVGTMKLLNVFDSSIGNTVMLYTNFAFWPSLAISLVPSNKGSLFKWAVVLIFELSLGVMAASFLAIIFGS